MSRGAWLEYLLPRWMLGSSTRRWWGRSASRIGLRDYDCACRWVPKLGVPSDREQLLESGSGLGLEGGQYVGVRVQRDTYVGMAKSLRHHLGVDATQQHEGRVDVAKVVKAQMREFSRPDDTPPGRA